VGGGGDFFVNVFYQYFFKSINIIKKWVQNIEYQAKSNILYLLTDLERIIIMFLCQSEIVQREEKIISDFGK